MNILNDASQQLLRSSLLNYTAVSPHICTGPVLATWSEEIKIKRTLVLNAPLVLNAHSCFPMHLLQ